MPGRLVKPLDYLQISTHAQVNDEVRTGQLDVQEFRPPQDILDLLTVDNPSKCGGGWRGQCAFPAKINREDGFATESRAKGADDGLYFGEFGHGHSWLSGD